MKYIKLIVLAVAFLFFSCKGKTGEVADKSLVVAKVFDDYLYKSELKGVIGSSISKKDSALVAQKFINSWIEERLFYKYALDNLDEKDLAIEKQLEDYKKAMIIYKYETELVKQKMDTTISIKEIGDYYLANESSFKLRDNIVKARYLKVNKKTEGVDKVPMLFKSKKSADSLALDNYCSKNAFSYFLDTDKWIVYDDLKKEMPLENLNPETFLKNNKFVTFKDSLYAYFLDINEYKLKNSLSPLSFEINNIRKILINKRKLQLIEKVKQEVVNDASSKKAFEIYEP
jgi:hypothetical protein